MCKELKSLVEDAHTALADLRNRNAEQAFSQALAILETNTPKVILPLICNPVQRVEHFLLLHNLQAEISNITRANSENHVQMTR